ncbi:MAG: membrane dipeptidase [Eubacterium sp.]|nr:membrane dipeptidase [Eubacterium sp.]
MNYYDCHADTLTEIPLSEDLRKNSCCLDLERVRAFAGNYTQVFALWKDASQLAVSQEDTEEAFWQMYQRALRLLLEQSAYVKWCQNASDMQEAHAQGKAAVFLAVEDVSLMGSLVSQMQKLGFRFAMLTWNYENTYGCGAVTCQEHGLTEEGRRLVEQLDSQQVILDISHLSDRGAEEVFALTASPVIASHSNVREVCGQARNLNNGQVKELVRRNGLLGLNFYKEFVGHKKTAADIRRHIDAVLELGGEDILAVGSDFDGCGDQLAAGIKGVQSIPYFKQLLEREGLESSITEKIFWKNAERFFQTYVL